MTKGRVAHLLGRWGSDDRGPAGAPLMTATYAYYNDDRVQSVTFGNGASRHYTYDNARRLTVIDHRDGTGKDGTTFLKLEYEYTAHGLPESITERDDTDVTAEVQFDYDTSAHPRSAHGRRPGYGI